MVAGSRAVIGITGSKKWRCLQGVRAWKAETAMPQPLSSQTCLTPPPRRCGVHEGGMQAPMDSKQEDVPSALLQRDWRTPLIIQHPEQAIPLVRPGAAQDVQTGFRAECTLTETGDSVSTLWTRARRGVEGQKWHETLNKMCKWDTCRDLSHSS